MVPRHGCLPVVELKTEEDNGNPNINEGGDDGENEVLEEIVDGACASVHHPQHLAGLPGHVPVEAELVDVLEKTDLGGMLIFMPLHQSPESPRL